MKIKVLSLNAKTALATAVYYLAILALVGLLGAIVVKLVIWPPCSITTRNECVVDGWSVAGLAGTVLAVAATLLAVLGAVAVAYWWLNLNEKVDRRVDEQIKTAIDQALKEQEKRITEQTTHLLVGQEKQFKETVSSMQGKTDTLKEQASNLEQRVQAVKKDLIIAITQLDPWLIEVWAAEEMFLNPFSEVGVRMLRKYLKYVDAFFPNEPRCADAVAKYGVDLSEIISPYGTPISYWEHALVWQQRIVANLESDYTKIAEGEIELRRPLIEAWKKQHGL